MKAKLTVFFEDPYWVGVFEREDEKEYQVARAIFGCEPTDAELYEFLQANYRNLEFSRSFQGEIQLERKVNFKRKQREVRKQANENGIGTKAQQAIKQVMEESKKGRKRDVRQQRREEEKLKFVLKQEKKKEKQKGH
ncbi:MAG TPA: YjdF family protein [Anaerolineales bacterium]|nr:YjdF family protein [Anaerolineales bacterium]HNM36918.1 YjdF family protein [Anaerolineales bacterium]